MKETKHATNKERAVYLTYLLGQNIAFQITLVVLVRYWQSTLGIAPLIVGTITLVSRIWDAINDPILGGVIQKVGKNKFGLYKPWAFVSAFLLPILVFAIFSAPFGTQSNGTIIWAAFSFILFQMVYTITDIPIFSLSMTMEPDNKKRIKLLFLGRIGAGLAGIVASLIFFGITNASAAQLGALNAYLLAGGVAAILTMLVMVPIFIVKERNIIVSNKRISLKAMFKFIGTNKHLLKLLLSMFLSGLFNMVFMTTITYLGTEFIQDGNLELIMPLNALFALAITFGLMFIINKLGAKKTIFIFELLGLSIVVIGALITFYYRFQLAFLLFIFGANFITNTPLTVAMGKLTQETIEYGHFHSGDRQEAFGFAAQTFTAKMMVGIGQFIANGILAACGFLSKIDPATNNPIPQTPQVMENMFWATFGILIVSAVIAIVTFGFWYNLRTKDVQIMVLANHGDISKEEAKKQFMINKKNKLILKKH